MDEIVTTIVNKTSETFLEESTTAIPKALVEFFIVFGSFFIPCTMGSILSHFIKREKIVKQSLAEHKKAPRVNKKKTIVAILVSAILPTIIMTALYDVLEQKVNNGVVLMAVAALFGAIGDDLRKMLTLRGIIAIIKVITNGITTIGQLEDVIDTQSENTDTPVSKSDNTNSMGISQPPADTGSSEDNSADAESSDCESDINDSS